MKTSMCPPHASPTENATSSATPKAATLGWPAFNTFCASSNTAPSMQPFETEPAIFPDRVTTIFEPRGRGLEPHVSTTVARAISSLFAVQVFSSLRTSRTSLSPPPARPAVEVGQHPSKVVESLHVVHGEEVIAIRKRGRHAPGERLVEVAMAQQSRDPGQPGREDEGLEVFAARDRVREDHQHARVTLHRAADIAHKHERPPPQPRALVEQTHELAAGTDRVPGRPPQVDCARPRRAKPAGLAFGDTPRRLRKQALDLLGLLPRHRVEVLVAKQLLGGVAARGLRHGARFLLAVHL